MRKAMSLVELLVVIAIITVLTALLIPAVQRVREAAQRTVCLNNFHQVALAIHVYHDGFGYYPTNDVNDQLTAWSWMMRVLPQMEESSVHGRCMTANVASATDASAAVIDGFLCPSDATQRIVRLPAPLPTSALIMQVIGGGPAATTGDARTFARTNIAGCDGNNYVGDCFPWPPTEQESVMQSIDYTYGNGVLPIRTPLSGPINFHGVSDGLGNTMLLGEIRRLNDDPPMWSISSRGAVASGYWTINGDTHSFSSNHPRVLHVAMACGRAGTINTKVAHSVFRAICSRSGGDASLDIVQ